MSKITLNNVSSFIDNTTAVSTVNGNNAIIQNALDNTLSLNGLQPNQMLANLDMNSNHIINLPAPASLLEPVRLSDVNLLNGGGTITIQGVPVGGTTGQVLTKTSNVDYQTNWNSLPTLFSNASTLEHCALGASVSSNALTISLKIQDGTTDPSTSNPATISFRDSTITSGAFSPIVLTSPTSLVISSGSTLGTANATAFRIWVVAFNDAGTVRLGAINCRSSTQIFSLNEDILYSSSSEGGIGAADSSGIFYTPTGISTKAIRILGYLEWANGLTTAGTWNALPTKIQTYSIGVRRPGEIVQSFTNTFAAGSGGSTASTTLVDTNLTGGMTLTSAANSVSWSFSMSTTINITGSAIYGNFARGGVNVSPQFIGAYGTAPANSSNVSMVHFEGGDFPGSLGPHTYTVRVKNAGTAATVFWCDTNGGGSLSLAEIMC